MGFNDDVPNLDNTIGADVPDIEECLEYLKELVDSPIQVDIYSGSRNMESAGETINVNTIGFQPDFNICFARLGNVSKSWGFSITGAISGVIATFADASTSNTTAAILVGDDTSNYQIGTLIPDSAGFDLTWMKSNNPAAGTAYFYILSIKVL